MLYICFAVAAIASGCGIWHTAWTMIDSMFESIVGAISGTDSACSIHLCLVDSMLKRMLPEVLTDHSGTVSSCEIVCNLNLCR